MDMYGAERTPLGVEAHCAVCGWEALFSDRKVSLTWASRVAGRHYVTRHVGQDEGEG